MTLTAWRSRPWRTGDLRRFAVLLAALALLLASFLFIVHCLAVPPAPLITLWLIVSTAAFVYDIRLDIKEETG